MNRFILNATFRFCLMTSLVLLAAAALPAAAGESAPTGMVAFFTTDSCPAGWKKADYVTGRLVVAVKDGTKVGGTVGTPLKDRENRTHQHSYSTTVTLKSKSISGASSCCNDHGAQSKYANPVTSPATTDPATSSLPFTQLVVCEKQ